MRTVIKFKADDIPGKTNAAHNVNEEFIEGCRFKEVDIKINDSYQ